MRSSQGGRSRAWWKGTITIPIPIDASLINGAKTCGEMAPVKYCDSEFGGQILQKQADDKTSGNWKAEGDNQKSVAMLRVRERGIGVAELTLIDFMRKLLCLNAMT